MEDVPPPLPEKTRNSISTVATQSTSYDAFLQSLEIPHINGLFDTQNYIVYRECDTLVIKDKNIIEITTNNPHAIRICKVSKNRCFRSPKVKYKIYFLQKDTGCLKFKTKCGERLLGVYITGESTRNRLKLGSIGDGNIHENYNINFWGNFCTENNRRCDLLYLYCSGMETEKNLKVSKFIRETRNLGQEACIIYNNDIQIEDLVNPKYIEKYFEVLIELLVILKENHIPRSKSRIFVILEQNLFNNIVCNYETQEPSDICVDLSSINLQYFK